MTRKQKIFIAEYLKDMNASRAAIAAGYSAKNSNVIGAQLLTKTEIKNAIDTALQERNNKLIANRNERLTFLTATMRNENIDIKHRLRAVELLSKISGDFIKQVEIKNTGYSLADIVMSIDN